MSASANTPICEAGSDPGECTAPTAVAVDRAEDILYVADDGNQEIDAYDAEGGAFIGDFPLGVSLGGIAVDNDEASAAHRDVYAFDSTNNRVLKLRPTGGSPPLELIDEDFGEGAFASTPKLDLGPGGVVHVVDNIGGGDRRVQKFDHEGEPIPLPPACAALEPGEFGENLRGFAVDSEGDFYLANAGGRPIGKYDAECDRIETPPFDEFHSSSVGLRTLAIDEEDNPFVGDSSRLNDGGETAIYHYDSAGAPLRVIYAFPTLTRRPISLAPHSTASGDVFAAERSPFGQAPGKVAHVSFPPPAFPPPGPVVHPEPGLTEADPVGNTFATLNTRINPEGTEPTSYFFEYVDQATYLAEGFDDPETTPVKAIVPESFPEFTAPLFGLAEADVAIGCEEPPQASCLAPETEYRFRAVAENSAGESTGPEGSFTTKEPFTIEATFATQVGTDAARIHAQVNPLNIPATGHFEYVTEATCLADVEAAEEEAVEDPEAHCFDRATSSSEVDFGSGEESVTRAVQLHSLEPGAAYRFRVFVENVFEGEFGEASSFTTFPLPQPAEPCPNDSLRAGASAALPDCRAHEMVSPVDKEGGEIVVNTSSGNLPAEVFQSAAAVGASGRGFTYSSNRAFADAISSPFTSQYIASRVPDSDGEWDPGEGWSTHGISPRREGAAFGRLLWLDTQYKAFSDDLRYGWLRTDSEPKLEEEAIAGYPNLYRYDNAADGFRAECPVQPPNQDRDEFVSEIQGFSADGQTTVVRANDRLTNEAVNDPGIFQLYLCSQGEGLALASVLPPSQGGDASEGNSSAGTHQDAEGAHRESNLHNALSADGERLYWTDSGEVSKSGPGKIYLRERPLAAGAECAGESTPCTVEVSEAVEAAGSDSPARFWTASPDGSRAIFSFTAGPLAGNLYEYDAESEAATPIAAGLGGLAGWSEDASRLYLVSTLELGGEGTAGEDNLHLYEAGGFTLVATLPGGTQVDVKCSIDAATPFGRCARATPDGLRLAFVSKDPLTGYDNADASSGEPAAEVFLFDSTAEGGEGDLVCVSCNPSGARPAGRDLGVGEDTSFVAARIPNHESSFQSSRVISSDGRRLFFESFDSLVPTDTNGTLDVYQWQRAGKGGCDAGDHDHFASNGGCLSLISSGQSPEDSEFLDADSDGTDVFFKTAESLWPEDPGLIDVYDARVGGGFPPPLDPRPPCEGEACQSPPPAPDFAMPGSGGLLGPGNVSPPPRNPCRAAARRAKALSGRAKRARRKASRAGAPRRRARMRRQARRLAKGAKRNARRAKRCRAARRPGAKAQRNPRRARR